MERELRVGHRQLFKHCHLLSTGGGANPTHGRQVPVVAADGGIEDA